MYDNGVYETDILTKNASMEQGDTSIADLYFNVGDGLNVFTQPTTRLTIGDDMLVIDGQSKLPNWWWRMWQWILLGWKWEKFD